MQAIVLKNEEQKKVQEFTLQGNSLESPESCGLYGSWMNGMNCKTVQNHHCHPTGHAVEFNNSATIKDDDVGSDLDGDDSEDDGNTEDDTHRDTQLAILADCNVPLLLYKCSGRPI